MRGICRECGERVLFARTEALAWQPLNVEPDAAGNVHAYQVTCTGKKAAPAAEPELPKGVTSLAAWRRDRRRKAGAR